LLPAVVMDALSFSALETPASSNLDEHYLTLYIRSSVLDDGRKHRPKHLELTMNNKLIYIVHFVDFFYS
jgi:hypothetical protein